MLLRPAAFSRPADGHGGCTQLTILDPVIKKFPNFRTMYTALPGFESDRRPVSHVNPRVKIFLTSLALLMIHLSIGVLYARLWAGLIWIDCFYFIASTVMTVGFGDYSFQHDNFSFIFASIYLMIGSGVMAFATGSALRLTIDKWNQEIELRIAKALLHAGGEEVSPMVVGLMALRALFIRAFGVLIALIVSVSMLISFLEGWSFLRSLYWSTTVVSTVGYGDVQVETHAGKVVASVFIPLGVVMTATVFSLLASIPFHIDKVEGEQSVFAQYGTALTVNSLDVIKKAQSLRKLGLSQNENFITRNEYILWLLLQLGKVSALDIKHCGQAFDLVDENGDGRLDISDVDYIRRTLGRSPRVSGPPQNFSIRRGISTVELPTEERMRMAILRSGSVLPSARL